MYKLLGRQTSGNVQKVLFILEEIGASFQREDYGRLFENTQTSEYKALNPTSKVPTLIAGDTVIWESNTILRYIAAVEAKNLTGDSPAQSTEVERWMDFLISAVNPGYLAAFKGGKLDPADRSPEYGAQTKDLAAQLGIIDRHLEGKSFMALEKFTIADIACAPILIRCMGFKIDRPEMPNIEKWLENMSSRPAFKAALAPAKKPVEAG
ncbi:MAG: glutathione S-transferase family protein [Rhizobiaceae bacterium]